MMSNQSSVQKKCISFFDLREHWFAFKKKFKNGGYENTNHYRNSELAFCSIVGYRKVNKYYKAMLQLCHNSKKFTDQQLDINILEAGWMGMLSNILIATNLIVRKMRQELKVCSIHCTSGWDRTPQNTSLVQMMLDPYFRTFEGFAALIEKDWIHFGHKMHQRLAIMNEDALSPETSPIFLMWLDCVYQVMNQLPNLFEFKQNYLIWLLDEVESCKYGNFLCRNERQRNFYGVRDKTFSIWIEMQLNKQLFKNESYAPQDLALPLVPKTEDIDMVLWQDFFCRFSQEADATA